MMTSSPSVAVLVSAGLNPVSGVARAARGDAVAMGLAQRIGGTHARVIHAGSAEEPALSDYLALGAGRIEVVEIASDAGCIPALAGAVSACDLVLTGLRGERGAGSGLLPYVLAEKLGRPVVVDALDIEVADGEALVVQFLPRGKRRRLAVRLPAVIAVNPAAVVGLGYSYQRRQSGRIIGMAPAAGAQDEVAPTWTIGPAGRQLLRLKAEEKRPAHERLKGAIVSDQKGGLVVTQGTPAEKARLILDYLERHRLFEP